MSLTITNEDNMQLMACYPDNYFDLAICDPEYGIGISNNPIRQKHKKKDWDNSIPEKQYFEELFRISKNQIIWGGNYFIDYLNNTQGFIIWDKKQPENFSLAMVEFAWSSIQSPAKMFRYSVQNEQNKIHPTQKPVALYKWLLDKYAKQGDKILDTHLGSGSIAIACHDYGFDLTACELDKEYFDKAMQRINNHVAQQKLF
jgi:site-specific DNA-methyltransferase (adenine-specific)